VNRRVYPFDPTWLDREYRKAFEALNEEEQDETRQQLTLLLSDLAACRHPCQDPNLARWKPTPYPGVGVSALYEYRTAQLGRVIARCPDVSPQGEVLLVAATLTHDHNRIKRLIVANKSAIGKEPKSKDDRSHKGGKR
jgi:hypothetical protein